MNLVTEIIQKNKLKLFHNTYSGDTHHHHREDN